MIKFSILLFFIILFSTSIRSQPNNSDIGFSTIFCNTHLQDEYISKNEYTGTSLAYGITWEDRSEIRILELSSHYNKINNLKSLMSRAELYDFSVLFTYLYHVNDYRIFNKKLNFYLGPGSSMIFQHRNQKVAGSTKALSFAYLVAVDLAAKGNLELSDKFEVSAFMSISPLSFVARMRSVKNPENLPTPVGFLHLFNLININSSLELKYKITDTIYFQSSYNFRYVRIFKWDKYRFIQDNIYLQFGMSF